ncbi:MAG TPA: mycofactocin-coupled SDR family oxidoreductase [Acidimicrobiales bacterium]|nr:mycofactocin-coupled SDR family oxidoreductase [Acidimicrobiales bacterium]
MGSLDGKVALITGAARGQGRSHAVALASEGADIVVCDVPRRMSTLTYPLATRQDLELTAKLVEQAGRRCLAVRLDVRDAAAVDSAVEQTVRELGRLDIVVANAGVVSTGPLAELTDEGWDELVSTNLGGVFHILRAAIPVMRRQKFGRIVVTSSMGGRMGIPNLAAYNATKWGTIGMAKSLALEVAKEGITVNVICPTTVQTPMVQPDPDAEVPDDFIKQMLRANPVPQPWLQPEDVSRGVLYLVTDPGVITGSVLEVGLGSSARMH